MKTKLKNILTNSPMIKKVLRSFLMTLFHLIFFIVVHEIGVRLALLLFGTVKSNLQWGITLQFSLVIFGILSLTMALLFEWVKKKYWYFILASVCLVFLGFFIDEIKYAPNRTLLLLLSGILGFALPVLFRMIMYSKSGCVPSSK